MLIVALKITKYRRTEMIKSKLKSLSFIIFTLLLIPLSLMIQPEQIVQKQYLLANAALVPSVTYE